MSTDATLLEEFRQFVKDKLDEDDESIFDKADWERFQKDDHYANCFLKHARMNQAFAYTLVEQCFTWRHSFKINDITESKLNPNVVKSGIFYVRGRSLNNAPILRTQICKNIRGAFNQHDLRTVFVHILEEHSKQSHLPIIVLFDLTDTGLRNVDLELVKFIISCFKIYYPSMLDMILAYEMPWVMSASWKLIKTWLGPEAREKVNFVDSVSITRFIDKANIVRHMGGTDDFEFNGSLFVPINNEGSAHARQSIKHVTPPQARRSVLVMEDLEGLQISPPDEITFDLNDPHDATWKYISLRNKGNRELAFKFKTTSPEKYSVRPGMGIIKENQELSVRVRVSQDVMSLKTVSEDKFLLLYKWLHGEGGNISDFWRTHYNDDDVKSHKIRCAILPVVDLKIAFNGDKEKLENVETTHDLVVGHQITPTSDSVKEERISMRFDLKLLQFMVICLIILTALNTFYLLCQKR